MAWAGCPDLDYGNGRNNAAYGNFLIASVLAHRGEDPLACHARGNQKRRMCINSGIEINVRIASSRGATMVSDKCLTTKLR